MVSRHQTSYLSEFEDAETENDYTFSCLATIYAVQKCLLFGKKHF